MKHVVKLKPTKIIEEDERYESISRITTSGYKAHRTITKQIETNS